MISSGKAVFGSLVKWYRSSPCRTKDPIRRGAFIILEVCQVICHIMNLCNKNAESTRLHLLLPGWDNGAVSSIAQVHPRLFLSRPKIRFLARFVLFEVTDACFCVYGIGKSWKKELNLKLLSRKSVFLTLYLLINIDTYSPRQHMFPHSPYTTPRTYRLCACADVGLTDISQFSSLCQKLKRLWVVELDWEFLTNIIDAYCPACGPRNPD